MVATTKPVEAAFPGQNGKIAFDSERDGNVEIFTMNPDGSNQTNISNTLSGEGQPSWSPDGTKIAFVSLRNGNNEIYTMNSDGSNQTRLTTHATSDIFPDWQPITASTNTAPTITSLRPPQALAQPTAHPS
jgi:Tol biopolymer transport system component